MLTTPVSYELQRPDPETAQQLQGLLKTAKGSIFEDSISGKELLDSLRRGDHTPDQVVTASCWLEIAALQQAPQLVRARADSSGSYAAAATLAAAEAAANCTQVSPINFWAVLQTDGSNNVPLGFEDQGGQQRGQYEPCGKKPAGLKLPSKLRASAGPCITDKRLVLMPINYNQHWFMIVADTAAGELRLYDSLRRYVGQSNHNWYLAAAAHYLQRIAKLYKRQVDLLSFQRVIVKELPQQIQSDCGIFTIMFARHAMRGIAFDSLSDASIQDYRRRLVARLYQHVKWGP